MLEEDVIDAIENHRFRFCMASIGAMLILIFHHLIIYEPEARPPSPMMTRKADADDHRALALLIERDDIRAMAHGEKRVELLFDVCQIPDYEKEYSDSHASMLARIYTI